MKTFAITALLSLLPISELRGAIPFAYYSGGWSIYIAYAYCVFFNALAAPLAYLFLTFFHQILYRWKFYANLFDRFIERARVKVHAYVEKYGMLGVFFFVAIPFPLTGAWTGTLGAWILGLSKRKTLLAVTLGVMTSGLIVCAIIMLGAGIHSVFIKQI